VERARRDEALLLFLGARRFQEWTEAGVFEAFWRKGLLAYDGLQCID
jgi:hypothetical protein